MKCLFNKDTGSVIHYVLDVKKTKSAYKVFWDENKFTWEKVKKFSYFSNDDMKSYELVEYINIEDLNKRIAEILEREFNNFLNRIKNTVDSNFDDITAFFVKESYSKIHVRILKKSDSIEFLKEDLSSLSKDNSEKYLEIIREYVRKKFLSSKKFIERNLCASSNGLVKKREEFDTGISILSTSFIKEVFKDKEEIYLNEDYRSENKFPKVSVITENAYIYDSFDSSIMNSHIRISPNELLSILPKANIVVNSKEENNYEISAIFIDENSYRNKVYACIINADGRIDIDSNFNIHESIEKLEDFSRFITRKDIFKFKMVKPNFAFYATKDFINERVKIKKCEDNVNVILNFASEYSNSNNYYNNLIGDKAYMHTLPILESAIKKFLGKDYDLFLLRSALD